jgi:MFS family permease
MPQSIRLATLLVFPLECMHDADTTVPLSAPTLASTPWQAWLSLLVLSICYVFSLLDRLIISLLVEPLKASLSLSDVQIGLLQGPAFAVLYATMGVPLGRLADLVNRRNMIAWAIAFWGICTGASGLARSFLGLAVARVGVGAGEAALTPAAYSLIGDSFRSDRLGRAMGVYTAGGAVGSGLALLIGAGVYRAFEAMQPIEMPVLGALQPWQATLIAVGLPGLLLALIVRLIVHEPARSHLSGSKTLREVLTIVRKRGRFYLPTFAVYAATAGMLYGFVSWTPSFLARSFALGTADVGARFGPIMLAAGLLGPLVAGNLADRLHARRGALAPFVVMNAFFVLIVIASLLAFRATSLDAALIGCGVVGFFGTGLLGLPPLALQLATAPEMRGQIAGINLMIGNLLGLGLGPVGVAAVSQHLLANESLGVALMWVIGVLALLGLIASLCIRAIATPRGSEFS